MRILWLTENYPPQRGGMSQSCDRIINGLRQNGYEVDIIHFTTKEVQMKHTQQYAGSLTTIPFLESESHTLNIAWNYIKDLGQFDYIALFGGYLAMIAAPIYASWLGAKLASFLRGNDFDTAIFTPRKREMLQYALEKSTIVFSVSSEKVQKVQRWLPSVNMHFVPNGIDLKEWKASESEQQFATHWKKQTGAGKKCLGLIGQLKPKKGVQFFVDALAKTSLAKDFHLLLIGEIEEKHEEELHQREITFTQIGFLDRYELLKYYLCCDAIVIPSFYDGMPNVMLEAGALGIPIIASAVDGMADVIEHGKDGLLFKAGDDDDCRKALYHFLDIEAQVQSLGNALKLKIQQSYSVGHEINRYKSLLI